MSKFKIEKNIPIPSRTTKNNILAPKYPFSEMSIGDSFFVHLKTTCSLKNDDQRNLANYFMGISKNSA